MKIEIEKKYELTNEDCEIIKTKTNFIEEVEIKDYYLDMPDYILFKNFRYLRLRNGQYELKITSKYDWIYKSDEYNDENEINKILSKFDISIDDPTGVMLVHTMREKYSYDFEGYNFILDIDRYQYGERYEIELLLDEYDENGWEMIEKLKNHLWLKAPTWALADKIITCAMYQNINIYEIMQKQKGNECFIRK